ncbi:hypothetical protein E2320_013538 [Naja naja]|nr:hypothetical protein E2320_013538 [Naja naja]
MEFSPCPHWDVLIDVIPKVTKHLLSNPVFTCIVLAACMEIAVVAGFAAFLGKYLEQQFNLTTSSANQLLGMTAIPCACLGIFLGGLLVKKLSLSALGAIQMAMLVSLVSTACYVSFLFLGCDTGPVAGITVPYGNKSTISSLAPYSACNSNCKCQMDSFTPVCGTDGITYLSACFAGCTNMNLTSCTCLTLASAGDATVLPGKCPSPGCQEAFLTFLCVMCVCSMIGAMAQTPSVIILIRTVSPELKSYALGVLFLLLRLLAGIDSTCLFWSTFCGEQGACALYDNVVYRYLYVSIAITLKSLAFLLYTTTWQCLRKNYKKYIKNHEGGLSTTEFFASTLTLDNLGRDSLGQNPSHRTKFIYNLEDHEWCENMESTTTRVLCRPFHALRLLLSHITGSPGQNVFPFIVSSCKSTRSTSTAVEMGKPIDVSGTSHDDIKLTSRAEEELTSPIDAELRVR